MKSLLEWEKIRRYSQKAGKEVMAIAEAAYLTAKDPEVSWRHKSLLMASLVYLLSPVDALPDLLPGGFSDDITVMLSALLGVGHVGKKHLKNCRKKYGLLVDNEKDEKENLNVGSDSETETES